MSSHDGVLVLKDEFFSWLEKQTSLVARAERLMSAHQEFSHLDELVDQRMAMIPLHDALAAAADPRVNVGVGDHRDHCFYHFTDLSARGSRAPLGADEYIDEVVGAVEEIL